MKRVLLWLMFTSLVSSLWCDEIGPKRKIIIGGDADYPPYEFINNQGIPDGYNVELSREIAQILNWEPEFRMGKWALVLDWLQNGTVDLVQGMAFSVDRAKSFSFSSAHSVTWRAIFVHKDTAILSETDLLDKSVAIQQNDVAEEYLKKQGFYGTLSQLPSQEIALKLLDNGDFDACVANYMIGMHIIREQNLSNVKALPQRIFQREYCYAALDPMIIAQVNDALQILNKNGTLNALHDKWFDRNTAQADIIKSRMKCTLIVMVAILLMALMLLICWQRARKKNRKLREEMETLRIQADTSSHELMVWRDDFARGPVVLYKCAINPLRVLYISQNVTNWGISQEEALKQDASLWDLIYSEDLEYMLDRSQSLNPGEDATLYYRIVNGEGQMRWVLDFCRLMQSPATGELCLYGYLIDFTSQKELEAQILESKEKAEASNIAKSHFLANMSHEIRTPLNGITGFLQVLMQMKASSEQKEIFEIMYSSSHNLLKIINDILDFSKIESGKMELMISDFNLRYLVDDLVNQFNHQIKEKKLLICSSIDDKIPDVLKGDQLRLKQILTNLLQNAIKFTERGKIEILAEIYTQAEAEIRLLLRVMDTGIGINPAKQQDIFDNYSQADSSITSKYGGTGLGLAIVKRLVEMMQGFVWVESELGTGSCFFIILPFATYMESPEHVATLPRMQIPAGAKLKGSILLVEDDTINQMVTIRQLETWGLQVELAKNGAEAVQMHIKKPYDLILMDIQMPLMDGITATSRIRDNDIITGKHSPIVAYTASAMVGDRERFIAAGMDEYIAKPVDIGDLFAIISRLIPQDN